MMMMMMNFVVHIVSNTFWSIYESDWVGLVIDVISVPVSGVDSRWVDVVPESNIPSDNLVYVTHESHLVVIDS